MDIVCVGDCGVDHYLPSGRLYFGGITANVARHLRVQLATEDDVHIVSCIGDDDGANLVRSSLAGCGIECHLVDVPGTTPVQFIKVLPDGEKQFVNYDEGVLDEFRFSAEQESVIVGSDLLVAPVYLQIVGLFDALMSINTRGKVAVDFADFLQHPDFDLLERHIAQIDIAFFGLAVGDRATIEHIGKLAAHHGKLFVVTLGAAGSQVFDGGRRYEHAAIPVDNVADTTGAGDAYAAAFLASYIHAASVEASMEQAARLAAKVVSYEGSYRPTDDEKSV